MRLWLMVQFVQIVKIVPAPTYFLPRGHGGGLRRGIEGLKRLEHLEPRPLAGSLSIRTVLYFALTMKNAVKILT
jgi:hypothetical protein